MTLSNWIAKTVKGMFANRRHPITKSRGFKLQLELLEDRVVPSANLYVGQPSQFVANVWTPGPNYAGFTNAATVSGVTGFTDLQAALNQAAADYGSTGTADTIRVAPNGSNNTYYNSDYNITAPVNLYGSNVYYNQGTPFNPAPSSYNNSDPEATVIQTPASTPAGYAYNDAFRILSSNVFIRGFFINGSSAADDGMSNLNKAGNTVQVNSVTIEFNIVQNFTKNTGFGSTGIYMDNADPGTTGPDTGKVSSGINIAHNFFAKAGAAPSGNTDGAVNLDDNLIATVAYNTINVNADSNSTSVGIEIGNYNSAGVAGTQSMYVTDNYITVGQDACGIFFFSFGQASNLIHVYSTGNSIQAASGVAPDGLQSTYGTSVRGDQSGAIITEQDAIGTMGGQLDKGIYAWDTASGSLVIYFSTVGTTTGTPAPVIGVDLRDVDTFTGDNSVGPVFISLTGGNINGTEYGLDVTAQNVAATANIGFATGATFINGLGTSAGNGVGINLDGIGAIASATNGTVNNPSNVTGQNAALQTAGSTSTSGLTKTFLVTGNHSAGNFCNVAGNSSGNGGVTATASTGSAGSLTVTAPGATVTLNSSPPGGVSVTNGVLTWAAGALSVGTYTLTFSQNSSPVVYLTVTFVVGAPPTINAPATASGHPGTAGSFAVTDTGTPLPVLSYVEMSGPTIPVGVTFNQYTGLFYWPSYLTSANDGTYVLKFTATNSLGSASTIVTWTLS